MILLTLRQFYIPSSLRKKSRVDVKFKCREVDLASLFLINTFYQWHKKDIKKRHLMKGAVSIYISAILVMRFQLTNIIGC